MQQAPLHMPSSTTQPVKLSIVIPGLERNLFSAPQSALQGFMTALTADASRIVTGNFVLPLKQVAETRDLYLLDMELDTPERVLQTTRINSADN